MAPPRSEARVAEAIAVLGAETPLGARVRAALEAVAVPSDRVDLFRSDEGEPTLSEYLGEARLIQPPDPDLIATHGVVFDCRPAAAGAGRDRRDASVLRLDLTGASRGPLADRRRRQPEGGSRGTLTVPHALSVVVFDLLEPLLRGPGFDRATVTIVRPASDLGPSGVEELRRQVTGLLSFSDVPTEILSRRLAFNCYPQDSGIPSEVGDEARVAAEVRALLGKPRAAVAVRLLWAPIFFGHGISIHLVPAEGVTTSDIDEAWNQAEGVEATDGGDACTPQATTGERRTLVAPAIGDGAGGVWVWAVADEAGSASAVEAVRFAQAAGRL